MAKIISKLTANRAGVVAIASFLVMTLCIYGYVRQNARNKAAAQAARTHGLVAHDHLRQIANTQAAPLLEQLQKQPNDAALLASIGKVYYTNYDFADAITFYEKSVSLKDDVNVRNNLGGLYFYSGDSRAAIGQFETILKHDPGNDSALFNLGLVKWQGAHDQAGALAAWQQLLKSHPEHPRRSEVEHMISQVKDAKPLQ